MISLIEAAAGRSGEKRRDLHPRIGVRMTPGSFDQRGIFTIEMSLQVQSEANAAILTMLI